MWASESENWKYLLFSCYDTEHIYREPTQTLVIIIHLNLGFEQKL